MLLVVALQGERITKFWLGKAWAMPWAGTGWKTLAGCPRWNPCFSTGEYEDGIYGFFTEAMMDLAGLDYSTPSMGPTIPLFGRECGSIWWIT